MKNRTKPRQTNKTRKNNYTQPGRLQSILKFNYIIIYSQISISASFQRGSLSSKTVLTSNELHGEALARKTPGRLIPRRETPGQKSLRNQLVGVFYQVENLLAGDPSTKKASSFQV